MCKTIKGIGQSPETEEIRGKWGGERNNKNNFACEDAGVHSLISSFRYPNNSRI